MLDGKRKDYYRILGVEMSATTREVRKAYRKLAKKHHPDLARSEIERSEREEMLKLLNEIYEVLSDPARRVEYDYTHRLYVGDTAARHKPAPREPTRDSRYRSREGDREDPPEEVIRNGERYIRLDNVRKRYKLKYEFEFYLKNDIIHFYTTPEGIYYIPISELERAHATDTNPQGVEDAKTPKCGLCGVTNPTLRERYFIHNSGFFHIRKMRIRGGLLCSRCRESEMWKAVGHNLLLGWWGFEAMLYNTGFIVISFLGGFRGKRSTKVIQEKLRRHAVEKKRFDMYQALSGIKAKLATSLPNRILDTLLYNDNHGIKAALFSLLVLVLTIKVIIWVS